MDYKNGRIYKITDIAYTKMYIGSTCQSLSKRFSNHKATYKQWQNGKCNKLTVYDIFNEFGIGNCKIELIEKFECNSKEELERKEGEIIKSNECVNKRIEGRTDKQYYQDNKDKIIEQHKQYYQDNKDKIKQNYQDNKDKIIEHKKQFYLDNKEKILEHKKQFYLDNKEKILEQRSQKVNCECGSTYSIGVKARHFKTTKHQNFITS